MLQTYGPVFEGWGFIRFLTPESANYVIQNGEYDVSRII
jgi:hypothetical protein